MGQRLEQAQAKAQALAEASTVGVAKWTDDRLGAASAARTYLNKIFPDHWSFMLGEIALYSFVVLVATGIFLTLYFVPSTKDVVYHGAYGPLRGQHVSEAFGSTVDISFGVRFGMVMRQMHHWACDVFVAAIVIHLCRIFFTGAFRRPRELNWMIGLTLLLLAIVNGYIGYSLPDDLVSGTGLRIAFSIFEAIPIVGSYAAFFLWGGNYPGTLLTPRFYTLHILIIPAIIGILIAVHLGLLIHQKHAQFRIKGATERNVVGSPFWPNYAMKAGGLFFIVSGALGILGGIAQINPIWLYGSYVPYQVSYAVQPDWYMGWIDGAMRIMPSWELHLPGHMLPTVFFPAILMPGLTFGMLYAWPFIETRFTKDHAEHHLLDRPRDRPVRTALGAAVLAFYFVLFGASATDVLANFFRISLNVVLWGFRFMAVIVPLVVGPVAYRICKELQEGGPSIGKRKRSSVIMRSATGGYTTTEAEPRPGDEVPELEPEELPEVVVPGPLEPAGVGARSGDGSGGDGSDGAEGAPASGAGSREGGSGVFRVPRRRYEWRPRRRRQVDGP